MGLSIVIPTLDEEDVVEETLRHAFRFTDRVCVSDGGSSDRTVAIARAAGALVVEGPPGRGGQLNRGARATEGDILLFLHADTRLPEEAHELILDSVGRGALGGGFHVRYESGSPALVHVGNRLIRLRTAVSGCPLGDQCQFITREAFESLGGFQDWPILEDVDLIRRLRRLGPTRIIDPPVSTSPRRFEEQGLARTVLGNWLIWSLYLLGVSPSRLARLYRNIR